MDSHIYTDYVVPPSYDSLLGKVSGVIESLLPHRISSRLPSYVIRFLCEVLKKKNLIFNDFAAHCMGTNKGESNRENATGP